MTRTGTQPNKSNSWTGAQQAVWTKRAEDYGKLDWVRKQDFIGAMIDFCEPEPHWNVLDVGTGHGAIAAALGPYVKKIMGIDIANEMIDRARAAHDAATNLMFQTGDVEQLDFPDDSVDLVTARMVFHHVGDVIKGLREILRVLKPSGRLVLCEGVPPDHLTRERYEEIFALKEERHTFSEAELINAFDQAKFSDILLKPYFMRQVSLNNWLANGAIDDEAITEIRRLHVDADDHFKTIYRLNEADGDLFMDWKFVIIRGIKPQSGDAW